MYIYVNVYTYGTRVVTSCVLYAPRCPPSPRRYVDLIIQHGALLWQRPRLEIPLPPAVVMCIYLYIDIREKEDLNLTSLPKTMDT